ncbi:MAG: serine/threonine protein kinase [Melioribacteraceae bacterium]|nr:serine/threonine protein kinase [Melioribacteraceae bacterium]
MENLIGRKVDHYKIVSLLGEGGMGVVFLAFDLRLERYVAIKFMHSRIVNDRAYRKKFKNEAKHQAGMSHPNIVTVFGFIENENLLGIVMEYIDGETAESLIKRKRKVSVEESLHILKQVLKGIHYAHTLGFIHRDIKPSNILIGKNGSVKVVDFGISSYSYYDENYTPTDGRFGTVLYLSPEQIKGQAVNLRSDIYSIGCTAYELLTGYPPFYSQSDFEILEHHVHRAPLPPSKYNPEIVPELDNLILRALAKTNIDRFSNCEKMYDEIKLLKISRISTTTAEFKYVPQKKKIGPVIVTLLFLSIIVLVTWFVYKNVKFNTTPESKPDSTTVQPIERFVK